MNRPITDYDAALATVQAALDLIDENFDFDIARHDDPAWPEPEERAALLALRAFRNELSGLAPAAQVEPWPINSAQHR